MTELIQWEPNGTMRLSADVDRFIESFGENAARFARPIAVLGATSIEHRRLNNQLAVALTQMHMQYEVARAEMVRRFQAQQAILDRTFTEHQAQLAGYRLATQMIRDMHHTMQRTLRRPDISDARRALTIETNMALLGALQHVLRQRADEMLRLDTVFQFPPLEPPPAGGVRR